MPGDWPDEQLAVPASVAAASTAVKISPGERSGPASARLAAGDHWIVAVQGFGATRVVLAAYDVAMSLAGDVRMPGISVAVMIVIAAFAIERLSGALLFLLSYSDSWNGFLEDPELAPDAAERKVRLRRFKLVGFVIASVFAAVIVWVFNIKVLGYLGLPDVPFVLDRLFTVIVLVAGSDQIRELIKGGPASAPPPEPEPIHITGSLVLTGTGEEPPLRPR